MNNIKNILWLNGKPHTMDCEKCRFLPYTVCDAHYRGIVAEVDLNGDCSGFRYSYKKMIKIFFKKFYKEFCEVINEAAKEWQDALDRLNGKYKDKE